MDRAAQRDVAEVVVVVTIAVFLWFGRGTFPGSDGVFVAALLHLPNLFLTAATLVWGVVASYVYRRSANLWANGLVHGLMSAWVCYALPHSVTHELRVGMEYVGLS